MGAPPAGRARNAPRYTPGGAALHQLMRELEGIGAEGVVLGGLSSARLAVLHSALQSAKTASALARERGSSRQATLRVVDALLAEGWLERADNPRHRRAALLRATALGTRTYYDAAQARAQALNAIAEGCDGAEVLAATRLVRLLRERGRSLRG